MNYALMGLGGVSVLQLVALLVLLRRRKALDLSRIDARLAHFGEALALLTDTTQTGFASVAAELERSGGRRAPVVSRAATSKRIVGAAKRGRSIQDIAASEEVSESEIRLHLGLASELPAETGMVHDAARPKAASRRRMGTLNIGV